MYKEILRDVIDGVCTIRFNRPDQMNAITPTMLNELNDAVQEAGENAEVRVIVLTGEGRAFSAGVDLKALNDVNIESGAVGAILDDPARTLIQSIRTVPKPVIAKVNGFCFTGALEIALACDLFVVTAEAKLGDTHAKWGLRPTWGMSQRLPARVGLIKAKELSFTARTFTGAEAVEMGIANRAVPRNDLDGAVGKLIKEMLENSAEAIAAYKVLYNEGADAPVTKGVAFEEKQQFDISDSMDRLADFLK